MREKDFEDLKDKVNGIIITARVVMIITWVTGVLCNGIIWLNHVSIEGVKPDITVSGFMITMAGMFWIISIVYTVWCYLNKIIPDDE